MLIPWRVPFTINLRVFMLCLNLAGAGHPQMVQFLLDLGADATSFAGDGKTPLEVGAGCGVLGLGGVKVEPPPDRSL